MSVEHWNPDEVAALSRMIDEGKTVQQIALELNCSLESVKSAIRDLAAMDRVGEGE